MGDGCGVVRGMRGLGRVCEMCMCLARGGVGGEGGEWMRGLDLGFNNPVGAGRVLDVCLGFGYGGVSDVGGEWVGRLVYILYIFIIKLLNKNQYESQ